jgi:hypothetical protein
VALERADLSQWHQPDEGRLAHRGRSARPEVWLISNTLKIWSFAAAIAALLPTILYLWEADRPDSLPILVFLTIPIAIVAGTVTGHPNTWAFCLGIAIAVSVTLGLLPSVMSFALLPLAAFLVFVLSKGRPSGKAVVAGLTAGLVIEVAILLASPYVPTSG